MLLQVALSLKVPEPLTYRYTGDSRDICIGKRVVVPVGPRLETGWISELSSEYRGRVKKIIGVVEDDFRPSPEVVATCMKMGEHYFISPGIFFDLWLPPEYKKKSNLQTCLQDRTVNLIYPNFFEITRAAARMPLKFFSKDALKMAHEPDLPGYDMRNDNFPCTKTVIQSYEREAVYAELAAEAKKRNLSLIIAVADNRTADYFMRRIPGVAAYHSGIPLKERKKIWLECARGKPMAVAGGAAALMLPFKKLMYVACDHPAAEIYQKSDYKEYSLSFMAEIRSQCEKADLVWADNVISLRHYAKRELYDIKDLRSKTYSFRIHPLKPREKRIPESLLELLGAYRAENRKILVVINKKNAQKYLFCAKCQKIIRCPECNGNLKITAGKVPVCMQCGFRMAGPSVCAKCGGELVRIDDISLESLARQLEKKLTGEKVPALTARDLNSNEKIASLLESESLVLATPAILKQEFCGIFPVIVYLKPESLMQFRDFQAAEKIFTLTARLKEMISHEGNIHVFSVFHFHYAFAAKTEEQFFIRELKYREWFDLPPFNDIYHIHVKGRNRRELGGIMRSVYTEWRDILCIKELKTVAPKTARGKWTGLLVAHTAAKKMRQFVAEKQKQVAVTIESG